MGMWQNNVRHGPGMVVTMNGVYYEGNFHQNKLTVSVMICVTSCECDDLCYFL